MEAPERIWAEDCSGEWKDNCGAWCEEKEGACDAEYIRADIHADLLKAAEDLADALRQYACKQNWVNGAEWNGIHAPRIVALDALTACNKAKEKSK